MTLEQSLQQLSHLECPHQVDVVDRVMAQVADRPYLQPVHRRRSLWKPIGATAAAAVVALVLINVLSVYTRTYDDAGLGVALMQANDYTSWSTVEEAAPNPIEYLYEE